MTSADLGGFTAAITADRRRDEQAVLLERMGLEVQMFPLLRTEPEDHSALRALTREITRDPPAYLLANTGYGMRTWFGLAEDWGERDALVEALRAKTSIAARGAKALGELRKVGLDAWYKAPGETLEEVVDRLLEEPLAGLQVVVQLHGEPPGAFLARFHQARAEVVCLPIYKMGGAERDASRALVQAVLDRKVDVVTFTAAPQVQALARAAEEEGVLGELREAFNAGGVLAACIGEVCAAAAKREGIDHPLVPEHPRLGSLATAVGAHLAANR